MVDHRFFAKSRSFTLSELAALCDAQLSHNTDPNQIIDDVASLSDAGAGQISFFDNVRYKDAFINSGASACVVSAAFAEIAPKDMSLLITPAPYKSYALIAQAFYPDKVSEAGIAKSAIVHKKTKIPKNSYIAHGAVIAEGATIGSSVWIGENTYIGPHVVIGDHCRIGSNATITHSLIGEHVHIYPGCCIGQDGFGFAIDPKGHVKVPQLGRVIIEAGCEIGANSCIDRGAGPDTVIGAGTWIDNLVQIGHNVKTGKGCVFVAQMGIAGSTTIGDFVVIGGQAGIAGHLNIGDGARIGGQSGIMRSVSAGEELLGSPAMPIKQYMRQIAVLKNLIKNKK